MDRLTIVLDILPEGRSDSGDVAHDLVHVTKRMLPAHGVIVWSSDENRYDFTGDEPSLRLLMALGLKRGVALTSETFEELAGIEERSGTMAWKLADDGWNMDRGSNFWGVVDCDELYLMFDTSAYFNNGVPRVPHDDVAGHIRTCEDCQGEGRSMLVDVNGLGTLEPS